MQVQTNLSNYLLVLRRMVQVSSINLPTSVLKTSQHNIQISVQPSAKKTSLLKSQWKRYSSDWTSNYRPKMENPQKPTIKLGQSNIGDAIQGSMLGTMFLRCQQMVRPLLKVPETDPR